MLKELADKIEKLVNEKVEPEIIGHEGVDYVKTSYGYERLHKPSTNVIEVNSLNGLIRLIKNTEDDSRGVMGVSAPLIVKVNFNEIVVMSALNTDKTRNYLFEANPMIPHLQMGQRLSVEEMIILLSTAYIPTENTDKFISSLSSLRIVEEVQFDDDGIGQTVTAKQGTSMNRNFQVQPIVKLKPIRTYAEIEQVESKFLFRVNKDGTVCLREADGGQWKYEVQKEIVEYLEDNLKDMIDSQTVVVVG